MATYKPSYVYNGGTTPWSITCTLGSLAASATVGRSSSVIDNTTNLFQDVLVFLQIKTGSGAIAGNKQVAVYAYAQDGNGNYEEEESNAPGTDASYTINSPTIFKLTAVLPVLTSSKTYSKAFTLARLWGGLLPPKYGIIVCNDTGTTFDTIEGNFIKEFVGIQWQGV